MMSNRSVLSRWCFYVSTSTNLLAWHRWVQTNEISEPRLWPQLFGPSNIKQATQWTFEHSATSYEAQLMSWCNHIKQILKIDWDRIFRSPTVKCLKSRLWSLFSGPIFIKLQQYWTAIAPSFSSYFVDVVWVPTCAFIPFFDVTGPKSAVFWALHTLLSAPGRPSSKRNHYFAIIATYCAILKYFRYPQPRAFHLQNLKQKVV